MENFRASPIRDPEPARRFAFGRRLFKEIIETALLTAVIFLSINLISARIRVESISMYPTLNPGEYVIVSKLSGWAGQLQRGDIVVFRLPSDPQQRYIKRLVGLPGDELQISDGRLYVNGHLLAEPYLQGTAGFNGRWLVSENSYFVMGDNRANSSDSRSWGDVATDLVIGEALFVYWPPSEWGLINGQVYAAQAP